MEKNQYDLFFNVLKRFHQAGILGDMILIGSWCVVLYRDYFQGQGIDHTALRTRDIGFLIPRPSRINKTVDVPELVKDLGFIVARHASGLIRLDHPDLMLEFLTPERGAGRSAPVPIPRLGMNAVALRFLNFLTDDVVHATAGDLRIALPHPVPFALHKLIVSQRRRKKDKGVKDSQMAVELLRALIQKGDGHKIRNTFDNIPRSWRTKILSGLNPRADHDIRAVLTP